ncbi:protein translocase subunit yidC [Albimonas donghaensis]|uniref:Membrane protein insertase YidC n=1 Tax=Albimonas donghaensis TaxID=356660 RepID=A0A1H2VC64_9RHOB|nr:membrane protein insertase YidC [Albimonas donghaensis]SDW65938.1 protein translocase subunit yidC [Albimonas donghaensis]
MDDQKNMIIAAALSFVVIAVWFVLFPPAPTELPPAQQIEQNVAGSPTAGAPSGVAPGTPDSLGTVGAPMSRDAALESAPRAMIQSPRVKGSLSLRGGRIDDLSLEDYKVTLEPDSPDVTLLSPLGSEHPFYAVYGWLPTAETPVATPGPNTEWAVEAGEVLTPETPLTLRWDNGEGQIFRREISLDDNYMFTVRQTVENTSETPVSLAPYGYVARRGEPETVNFYILHEGAIAKFDGVLEEYDYDDMQDFEGTAGPGERVQSESVAEAGWLGFTDKYWMATLIPTPGQPFDATFRYVSRQEGPEYRTEMRLPVVTVAAGATAQAETQLFAGAKEYNTIVAYEDAGVPRFIDSIDWGWFFFLTKPFAQLLLFYEGLIGNMGWSIIAMTLTVKIVLFPLAYKSYVAMSKMKKLQPEMEKIKERVGDDKMKMQQEVMALYKREKANPAAGCLPILLQIPIFFSLYKVLFVSLEMRHAPFILWIKDMSAPDPTSILNLFGLLPFAAPDESSMLALLSIGVFPILLGITMWLQQKLNPAPTDATQAMIFAWMPWVFMFMLGQFAVGLVIYWVANNIITFTQQYLIMRSQGVEVDVLGNVKRSLKLKKKTKA